MKLTVQTTNNLYLAEGKNLEENLSKRIKGMGLKNALIVMGNPFFKKAGYLSKLQEALTLEKISSHVFSDFTQANYQTVHQASQKAIDTQADFIITVGGGSAHDLGKSAALMSQHQNHDLMDLLQGKVDYSGWTYLPVITIPTMPGSGSENDGDTQLYGNDGQAYGLSNIQPSLTFINPAYLKTLPLKMLFQGSLTIFSQLTMMYLSYDRNHLAEQTLEIYLKDLEQVLRQIKHNEAATDEDLSFILQLSSLALGKHIQYNKTFDWSTMLITMQMITRWHIGYARAFALLLPGWVKEIGSHSPAYNDYCHLLQLDPDKPQKGIQAFYRELGMADRYSKETDFKPVEKQSDFAKKLIGLDSLVGKLQKDRIMAILALVE